MVTRLRPDSADQPLLEQIQNLIAAANRTEFTAELELLVDLLESGSEVVCALPDSSMTPTEVAAYLGVSRPYVYRLLDRGVLPCHNVGRDRRVPTASVLDYALRRDDGRRVLAETFASAEADRQALIAELAGAD
jgi:excisionase family DNA binding protein